MQSTDITTVPAPRGVSEGLRLFWLVATWFVLLGLFHVFPSADTGITTLFCRADSARAGICGLFPFRDDPLTGAIRLTLYWVPIVALVLIIADLVRLYALDRWRDRDRLRDELLAVTAYLLGPLLVVNAVLKAHSGRPRPDDTTLFGGRLDFVAAGDFSGACHSNCSFVSGEAAAAGWLLCLLPLLGSRFRGPATVAIVLVSVATPLLRVAMGGHFLSDAMLGWLLGAASLPALSVLSKPLLRRKTATLDRPG
jgi:lipid A 4'-phosphatase